MAQHSMTTRSKSKNKQESNILKNDDKNTNDKKITIKFHSQAFYQFYIGYSDSESGNESDNESDEGNMQEVYYLFKEYFKNKEWILSGSRMDIEKIIENIMGEKYHMEYTMTHRFINGGMASYI